eukprot:g7864.t1
MSKPDTMRRSSFDRVRKSDTVKDAKFFELALDTPLIFNSPSTDDVTHTNTEHDEFLLKSIPESRQGSFASGPSKWEDSYQIELKNESDRILQSFQQNPVEGEFESSTLAGTSGGFEDNLSDRLGLGTLHPTQLTLVTEKTNTGGSSLDTGVSFRRTLGSVQFSRIGGRLLLGNRSGNRNREERRHQELRDRILPSNSGFSPEFYLTHVHSNTSLEELKNGLRFLEVELSKRTDQLKTLVKEHFEGFVSCKNTIDDVQFRLKQNEAQNRGVNTSSLKSSIASVQLELANSFAPILERQERVEQLKNVMEILKRFKSSFNLPSSIRQLGQNQEYSQVVSEYRRAKSLMTGGEFATWSGLFDEVNKEAMEVCLQINQKLMDPLLSPEELQELILCLCYLRHEGLELTTTSPEPIKQWIDSVEDYIHHEIQKLATRNQHHLQIRAQTENANAMDKRKKRTLTSPFERVDNYSIEVNNERMSLDCSMAQQWTDYTSQLCKLLNEFLPKLWKLQSNKTLQEVPDIDEDIQSSIAEELFHVDAVTRGVLDTFNSRIVEAVEGVLMSDGLLSPPVFQLLSDIRLFATELREYPEFVPQMLCELIREVYKMCTSYLCTFLRQQMASLGEWEDWKIRIGSYCKNHPVTSVPFRLGASVRDVMEQFKAIKAEQDQWPNKSQQIESTSLNQAFNECFESFAMAVEGLAAEILQPNEPITRRIGSMMEISKLLILISNSMYIRKRLLPDLISQYSDFLQLSPGQNQEEEHLFTPFLNLEKTMMTTYLDHSKKVLEKAIDSTIAAEKENPPMPITGFNASEVPSEWLAIIVETQAEVLKYVPNKANEVVVSMVLHLVRKLKLRVQDLHHLGYLLQIYSDCIFLETVLIGIEVRDVHRAWDAIYERLSALVANQVNRMKENSTTQTPSTKVDVGWNILNSFEESELKDHSKLHGKLQRMFKESCKESIKKRYINLVSLCRYRIKDRS